MWFLWNSLILTSRHYHRIAHLLSTLLMWPWDQFFDFETNFFPTHLHTACAAQTFVSTMNSGFDRNTITTITPCIQICQSECFLWYNLLILLPESAGWFMGAACRVQWAAYYQNMLDSFYLNTLTRLEPPRWSCHWVQCVGFVRSRDSGRFHKDSLTAFNESCSTSLKFPLFVSPNSEVLCSVADEVPNQAQLTAHTEKTGVISPWFTVSGALPSHLCEVKKGAKQRCDVHRHTGIIQPEKYLSLAARYSLSQVCVRECVWKTTCKRIFSFLCQKSQ